MSKAQAMRLLGPRDPQASFPAVNTNVTLWFQLDSWFRSVRNGVRQHPQHQGQAGGPDAFLVITSNMLPRAMAEQA